MLVDYIDTDISLVVYKQYKNSEYKEPKEMLESILSHVITILPSRFFIVFYNPFNYGHKAWSLGKETRQLHVYVVLILSTLKEGWQAKASAVKFELQT